MSTEVAERWLEAVAILSSEVNPTDDPHKIAARGFTFGLLLAMRHPEYARAVWASMDLPVEGTSGDVMDELVKQLPIGER